jgi:hypothetical protein
MGVTIVRQAAVCAVVSLSLLFAVACQRGALKGPPPGQHHGKESKRVFAVYIYTEGNQCFADWPVATLWKTEQQTVDWISDDDGEYTVDFGQGHNGSPFAAPTFHVLKDKDAPSGDLTQSGKYYDYAIRSGDANGNICKPPSDPGLYVK